MASAADYAMDAPRGEKESDERLEEAKHINTIENLPDPDANLTEEERAAEVSPVHTLAQYTRTNTLTFSQDKKLLRKLDLHLIPWLSLLYLVSFLDRTNIGNAKVDGLQQDLGMSNTQYNNSLTIFFVSYSVFEPLTNVLLKKMKPSVFLPLIMVLWGICMTCMGLVHNYSGLMAAVSAPPMLVSSLSSANSHSVGSLEWRKPGSSLELIIFSRAGTNGQNSASEQLSSSQPQHSPVRLEGSWPQQLLRCLAWVASRAGRGFLYVNLPHLMPYPDFTNSD